MNFFVVFTLFCVIGIALYIVIVLSSEERKIRQEEKELTKVETPLQKAAINISNFDDALEKAKGNSLLLEEIKKQLLDNLAAANKKGNTDLVRLYNSQLKKLNDYLD